MQHIMKNLLNTVYGALVLGYALGVAACSDNVHDFSKTTPADEAVSIYIKDSVFTYSVDWNLNMEYTASMDTVLVRFPVHLTEAVEHDVEVMLMVDDQLRINYNTAHDINYKPVEAEYVELTNQRLIIPAGKTQSDSVVTVVCKRPVSWFQDTTGYMIPVRMRYYKGGGVKPGYEERHSRIVVNTSRVNGVFFEPASVVVPYIVDEGVNIGGDFITLNEQSFNLSALWKSSANVTLTVDNDLIEAYNDSLGTDLQPVPTGDLQQSYTFSLAGERMEGDVYQKPFTLNYTGNGLDDTRGYLIPLVITNVEGEDIEIVPVKSVFYVRIDVGLGYVTSVSSAPGTRVSDRSLFTASATNANTGAALGGSYATLFDGNGTNMPGAWTVPVNLTVDLGAEITGITGLCLRVNNQMNGMYINAGYYLRRFDVNIATAAMQVSGVQASMGGLAGLSPNEYCYVRFNQPITARYIYINNININISSGYSMITEFDIYQ